MKEAFSIALQVVLIGSLVGFMITIILLAIKTKNTWERGLRIAAIFAGAMISLGAQASGLSYANYTVKTLAGARPASALAYGLATFIPALMGSAIGFYFARTMRKNETMGIRLLGFIGMLASTAFMEVYIEAASLKGIQLGATALPNIGFTAGVILTVVLTARTEQDNASHSSNVIIDRLKHSLYDRIISSTSHTNSASSIVDNNTTNRDPWA